ncbi:uncharacterized protein FOMMEDRAFT_94441 [Fomitiporia mediterranea MF3/22]|uniref:uncharacterized protein n=1 Tax=Fomitiporia mediterranea (strain MF3/22) TaxID=694068 RepID=UPI0004408843|nr:uncharacterized protein FOMMEDRAFT_94441 [Fomitiporia mediterranea MF3/22]EJC99115.1 hypothetical protein FOMMEDRAFT_94441 [Fomitiporia mediterranea MF3/22]
MPVSYKTTLKEDNDQNWELIPAKDGVPAYYEYQQRIETGRLDDREYRIIRLENNLEAAIVRDKDAELSAACMDIAIGSTNDPDDMPGTAHFCEHLMFMGSEKHKQENGFQEYLNLNSGVYNASTTYSNTKFFFEVDSDALHGALELFSEFFYCPLFHKDSALREIKAVDSEYSKNRQNDTWRLAYLDNSIVHPGHPLKKFSTGNKDTFRNSFRSIGSSMRARSETSQSARSGSLSRTSSSTPNRSNLQDDRARAEKEAAAKAKKEAEEAAALKARERLMQWWKKEYCAGRMRLAVVGRDSLDELTRSVVNLFWLIKNTKQDPAPLVSSDQPYGKEELGKIVYVKTIEEMYQITITFPIPWQVPLWRESPTYFITHLLGHEGQGSLHAYLKNKGWIISLVAGDAIPGRGISLFKVWIALTKDGFKNYQEVILTCFKFINLLHGSTFPEWMQKELKIIQEISFRFEEKGHAVPHACSIATSSMRFPAPRALLLSGPVLFWEWDEKSVSNILKGMNIENCYIVVAAKDHDHLHGESWHKERWYGAEYVKKPFGAQFIADARRDNNIPEITLPAQNPFLPENFEVHKVHVERPRKRPVLIKRSPLMEVWHKKDDQFWVPKAIVMIAARTPIAGSSPNLRALTLTRLFVYLVEDALAEYSYNANVANLGYNIQSAATGFKITIGGFNDKLHVLAEAVLRKIRHLEIRKDRLKIVIEQAERNLNNLDLQDPSDLSIRYLNYLADDYEFRKEEEQEVLKGITVAELSKHVDELLSELKFIVLVTGNLGKERVLHSKPVAEDKLPKLRTRLLRKDTQDATGCNYVWKLPVPNTREANSSIAYYCHVGNYSDPRTRVTCSLLSQILDEPTFDFLRTKEQLGYNVYSEMVADIESIGWRLVIQSEMASEYLESRIEAFLRYMRKIIRGMLVEKLDEHKRSLGRIWTAKVKHVPQETATFWSSIASGYYDFERSETDAKLLRDVSLSDVRTMFERCLDPSSEKRCKLSVHMHSKRPPKSPGEPAPPNVSRRTAQEFLSLLKKEGIFVDEKEYNSMCEVEVTVPEMHEYLEKTSLNDLLKRNHDKVKDLFGKLNSLVKKYPAKPALEAEHIHDGAKFKQGLHLSDLAKPVEKFKVE